MTSIRQTDPAQPAEADPALTASLRASLAPETRPGAASVHPPRAKAHRAHNDDILFVGMNPGASEEAAALKQWARVTVVASSKVPDQIRVQDGHGPGEVLDLSDPSGRQAFADSLKLPAAQAGAIADALASADSGARDELAQIARVWSRAERGGAIPSRLVLSGHCAGAGIWGEGNGTLSWEALGKLAAAMPKAARQVEDLHLAACYSGSEDVLNQMRGMFPKLKTAWAYDGSAPGSASGATVHQKLWERSTRGAQAHLNRDVAAHTRKGENVAVWTRAEGYQNGRPAPSLEESYRALQDAQPTFDAAFNGALPVPDAQSGPLRSYYNTLQRVLENPALDAASRSELTTQRESALRLLYYSSNVAPKFSSTYASDIERGYAALQMSPPDFGAMSRRDALAATQDFKSMLAQRRDVPAEAQRLAGLLDGLTRLDAQLIPNRWL